MTFVMGLLVALARRILRDELQKLQASIDNACFLADMREERANETEKDLVNARASGKRLEAEIEKLMAQLQLLTHENTELKQQIEIHNDKYLNMKESKRASEKREEDQRAINRELELRLRKIRELLG